MRRYSHSVTPFRNNCYNVIEEHAINLSATPRNPLQGFTSSVVSVKDARQMSERIIASLIAYADVEFCAVYMKRQRQFCLTSIKSDILIKLPSRINANSEFAAAVLNGAAPVPGENLPLLQGISTGYALPLALKGYFLGFIVIGRKKSGCFRDKDAVNFTRMCQEFSLDLLVSYFEEYQKVTDEKYLLLLEKERLESASQISEAYRHELGNIINIISLAASSLIIEEGRYPSKKMMKTALNSIRENVKRAQTIFNMISRYNEHVKEAPGCRDMSALLEDVISPHEKDMKKNNIRLAVSLEPKTWVLAGENLKDALSYVFKASLGAIEYHGPDKKSITVRLKKNDGKAFIEVSDTGGDATANAIYKGMSIERGRDGGLRYFMARKIVFDHCGTLEVSSFSKGEGTTCTVTLPLCDTACENGLLL